MKKSSQALKILAGAAALLAASISHAYQPTWASVDQHNPAPEWYQDAKFGIYFHWGPYSVAAYGSEWYARNMYRSGSNEFNHQTSVYGDPNSVFGYQDFINGKNDLSGHFTQFAPKLTSAGGNWDPAAWAQLFSDAGAKFAGPVTEHHDGFSLWGSKVNEWNAVSKGPHLDLLGQLATAIRAKNLKLMTTFHTAYHFNGYYQYVPAQSDPSLKKLFGQLGSTAENQLWFDKLKEVIDTYHPDIMYHDFHMPQVAESQRLNYLAYYYNSAIANNNQEVVVNWKEYESGFNTNGEVACFERGGPADLTTPYWLSSDAVSSSSWSYTSGMRYYATAALLDALIDRVSKNGTMQLDIAPMADGTIPQGQKDILLGIGNWLKNFGEGIYSTRAWLYGVYGEGPTKMGAGSFVTPTVGTNTDIRFTRNKANTVLYATVMGWPGNGSQLNITTLNNSRINLSSLTNVSLLGATPGTYISLGHFQDAQGLKITMPNTQPYTTTAYVVKLSFAGQIPSLSPASGHTYEAENLARTATATTTVDSDPQFSSGKSVKLNGTVGDYVEFTIPNAPTGNHSVTIHYRALNSRGQVQLKTDGITKNTVDQYGAADTFGNIVNLGQHVFNGGNSLLRFTVTGKTGASTGYTASIDSITLTPIP